MYKKIVALLAVVAISMATVASAETTIDEQAVNENTEISTDYITSEETEAGDEEETEISEEGFNEEAASPEEEPIISHFSKMLLGSQPPAAPTVNVGNSGVNVEFEDIFEWGKNYLADDENASGGKYVKSGAVGSEVPVGGYSQEVKINVTDAGKYSIHFLTQMVRENLSKVSVTFDGEKFVDNYDDVGLNHSSTAILAVTQTRGSNFVEDFWIEKELTAGEHTLVLSISREGMTANAVAFDNIFIYQPKEYTSILVNCEEYFSSGDEIIMDVLDQDGIAVDSRNYKSLSFTTTTPQVIKISGNRAYARNCGTGNIKVEMVAGDKTFTKDITVNVAASNGLIVKSVKKQGTTVAVTLYATKNYTLKENVSLVSYDLIRGFKSLFLKSQTIKLGDIPEGQESKVEFDISEWGEYKVLNLFMHKNAIGQSFSIITMVTDIK